MSDLYAPIKVHEHGFVELIDVMGGDAAILQAARVSYNKDGIEKSPTEDRGLIRYLMRNRHTTPFEMVEFKFHCKMPISVARQWIRHRTANVNEISARYVQLPEEFYVPAPERIQSQSTTNKQGSSGDPLADADSEAADFASEAQDAFNSYKRRINSGMAKELARNNLPLSTYTRWYWKIDLHNLLHFLGLRMDGHAQSEIRDYANAMASIVKQVCPLAWEAFEDFRLGSVAFSRIEMSVLNDVLVMMKTGRDWCYALENCRDVFPTKREHEEFLVKIKPWANFE